MKCETCLYNKNCQFLAKHQKAVVEGCTAYKSAADFVEVLHGEWAEREIAKATYLSCSRCGWARIGVAVAEHYRYCPNCGAKMDGGNHIDLT